MPQDILYLTKRHDRSNTVCIARERLEVRCKRDKADGASEDFKEVFLQARHEKGRVDMLYMENHIGRITISDAYLHELTEQTVMQCFGVAGFASVRVTDKLFEGRFSPIEIEDDENKLNISVHVKVMYGVNIPAVVNALIHKVEFVIEDAVRIPVNRVRVYVDEIVEA